MFIQYTIILISIILSNCQQIFYYIIFYFWSIDKKKYNFHTSNLLITRHVWNWSRNHLAVFWNYWLNNVTCQRLLYKNKYFIIINITNVMFYTLLFLIFFLFLFFFNHLFITRRKFKECTDWELNYFSSHSLTLLFIIYSR